MTSLPSIIPADQRPPDLEAMWATAIAAGADDEAPWLVLADACDEWGFHGLAAACRVKGSGYPPWKFAWQSGRPAILIVPNGGWWSIKYAGEVGFSVYANGSERETAVDWSRAEPVLRGDGMAG
jgi:hypothetical protein